MSIDEQSAQVLYQAGSQPSFKGPDDYFTGDVTVDVLFPANETARYSGAYVTFQPGARTAWHCHPAGQHMLVVSGVALTGTRDGKVYEFQEGEAVWCPSDVDHWHGATPHIPMTHLALTGTLDDQNVIWKEKVSNEEYQAGYQRAHATGARTDALSARQRAIAPISAFTANGNLSMLKTAIKQGLDAGLTINEIQEIQIQLYAYAGFPRALNGLGTLLTVVEERKDEGIKDKVGESPKAMPEGPRSRELGKEVQTRLSGQPVTGPLFDFAPGINELLQSHLFGDLFARGVLDEQSRELVTVSALASLDGVESQLKAHIRIATNVGLTREDLTALAAVLGKLVGRKEGDRVGAAIAAVLPEPG